MNALVFVLPLLAADERSEAVVHQQDVVEAAALAVARARQEGARKRDVAALMVVYRAAADRLAALEPAADVSSDDGAHHAAVSALLAATAQGGSDPSARAVVDQWLGALEPRLEVLEAALAASGSVQSPQLARAMVVDVRTQCVAVMAASAHDAAEADADAREARLRSAALAATMAPGAPGGFENELERRTLAASAAEADRHAAIDWAIHTRAAALCNESAAPIPPG